MADVKIFRREITQKTSVVIAGWNNLGAVVVARYSRGSTVRALTLRSSRRVCGVLEDVRVGVEMDPGTVNLHPVTEQAEVKAGEAEVLRWRRNSHIISGGLIVVRLLLDVVVVVSFAFGFAAGAGVRLLFFLGTEVLVVVKVFEGASPAAGSSSNAVDVRTADRQCLHRIIDLLTWHECTQCTTHRAAATTISVPPPTILVVDEEQSIVFSDCPSVRPSVRCRLIPK